MSKGYTKALASTAPDAPATALPHGGSGCDGAAIAAIVEYQESARDSEVLTLHDAQI